MQYTAHHDCTTPDLLYCTSQCTYGNIGIKLFLNSSSAYKMNIRQAGSDDGRLVSSLSDLLDKCLALDPQRRISVSDSLKHPFFTLH